MIETAIDDHEPGQVVRFGSPYHGKLFMPRTAPQVAWLQAGPVRLTLPRYFYRDAQLDHWANPGNCWRFRDPRAREYVPNYPMPPGMRWQADLLFGSNGILYAQQQMESTTAPWIFHDGARNWIATYQYNQLTLRQTPVIRRLEPGSAHEDEVHRLPLTRVDNSPPPAWEQNREVMIDVTPTGDRVLFALIPAYDYRIPIGRSRPAHRIYELVIDREPDTGALRATYACIRYEADMQTIHRAWAPSVTTYYDAIVRHYWREEPGNVPNPPPRIGEFEVVGPLPADPPSSSSHAGSIVPETAPNWSVICSMYYGPDGEHREVRLDCSTQISQSITLSIGVDNFEAGNDRDVNSVLDYRVTQSRAGSWTATLQLVVGGEIVSSANLAASYSSQRTWQYHGVLDAVYAPVDESWSRESLSGGYQNSVQVDGHTYLQQGGNLDSGDAGGVSLSAFSGAWPIIELPFRSSNQEEDEYITDFWLEVARYSSTMHCLGIVDQGERTEHSGITRRRYTAYNAGHPGGGLPGFRQYGLGWNGQLYGSYNPSTGEAVRDSDIPFTWV